jgi:hypothetical protein
LAGRRIVSGMSEETRRDSKDGGHVSWLEDHERRPGCWGWSDLIDGRTNGHSARSLLVDDPQAALRQGSAAAHARVDGLEQAK